MIFETVKTEHSGTWEIERLDSGIYHARRRNELKPNQRHCGMTDEVERRSLAEFEMELNVQRGLWRALIDYCKKPAAS